MSDTTGIKEAIESFRRSPNHETSWQLQQRIGTGELSDADIIHTFMDAALNVVRCGPPQAVAIFISRLIGNMDAANLYHCIPKLAEIIGQAAKDRNDAQPLCLRAAIRVMTALCSKGETSWGIPLSQLPHPVKTKDVGVRVLMLNCFHLYVGKQRSFGADHVAYLKKAITVKDAHVKEAAIKSLAKCGSFCAVENPSQPLTLVSKLVEEPQEARFHQPTAEALAAFTLLLGRSTSEKSGAKAGKWATGWFKSSADGTSPLEQLDALLKAHSGSPQAVAVLSQALCLVLEQTISLARLREDVEEATKALLQPSPKDDRTASAPTVARGLVLFSRRLPSEELRRQLLLALRPGIDVKAPKGYCLCSLQTVFGVLHHIPSRATSVNDLLGPCEELLRNSQTPNSVGQLAAHVAALLIDADVARLHSMLVSHSTETHKVLMKVLPQMKQPLQQRLLRKVETKLSEIAEDMESGISRPPDQQFVAFELYAALLHALVADRRVPERFTESLSGLLKSLHLANASSSNVKQGHRAVQNALSAVRIACQTNSVPRDGDAAQYVVKLLESAPVGAHFSLRAAAFDALAQALPRDDETAVRLALAELKTCSMSATPASWPAKLASLGQASHAADADEYVTSGRVVALDAALRFLGEASVAQEFSKTKSILVRIFDIYSEISQLPEVIQNTLRRNVIIAIHCITEHVASQAAASGKKWASAAQIDAATTLRSQLVGDFLKSESSKIQALAALSLSNVYYIAGAPTVNPQQLLLQKELPRKALSFLAGAFTVNSDVNHPDVAQLRAFGRSSISESLLKIPDFNANDAVVGLRVLQTMEAGSGGVAHAVLDKCLQFEIYDLGALSAIGGLCTSATPVPPALIHSVLQLQSDAVMRSGDGEGVSHAVSLSLSLGVSAVPISIFHAMYTADNVCLSAPSSIKKETLDSLSAHPEISVRLGQSLFAAIDREWHQEARRSLRQAIKAVTELSLASEELQRWRKLIPLVLAAKPPRYDDSDQRMREDEDDGGIQKKKVSKRSLTSETSAKLAAGGALVILCNGPAHVLCETVDALLAICSLVEVINEAAPIALEACNAAFRNPAQREVTQFVERRLPLSAALRGILPVVIASEAFEGALDAIAGFAFLPQMDEGTMVKCISAVVEVVDNDTFVSAKLLRTICSISDKGEIARWGTLVQRCSAFLETHAVLDALLVQIEAVGNRILIPYQLCVSAATSPGELLCIQEISSVFAKIISPSQRLQQAFAQLLVLGFGLLSPHELCAEASSFSALEALNNTAKVAFAQSLFTRAISREIPCEFAASTFAEAMQCGVQLQASEDLMNHMVQYFLQSSLPSRVLLKLVVGCSKSNAALSSGVLISLLLAIDLMDLCKSCDDFETLVTYVERNIDQPVREGIMYTASSHAARVICLASVPLSAEPPVLSASLIASVQQMFNTAISNSSTLLQFIACNPALCVVTMLTLICDQDGLTVESQKWLLEASTHLVVNDSGRLNSWLSLPQRCSFAVSIIAQLSTVPTLRLEVAKSLQSMAAARSAEMRAALQAQPADVVDRLRTIMRGEHAPSETQDAAPAPPASAPPRRTQRLAINISSFQQS